MPLQKFEILPFVERILNSSNSWNNWSFFDIRNDLACGKFKTRKFHFLDAMRIEPLASFIFWKTIRKKRALKGKR